MGGSPDENNANEDDVSHMGSGNGDGSHASCKGLFASVGVK